MQYPLQAFLGEVTRSNSDPLQTTLFSKESVLFAVDADKTIVMRQRYSQAKGLTRHQTSAFVPELNSQQGHPTTLVTNLASIQYEHYLKQLPLSGFPKVLNDLEHTVVAWYMVGLNPSVPAEIDELGISQGGTGIYGVGETVDATVEAAMTVDGRMWLKWSCNPTLISTRSTIPFNFADNLGARTSVVTSHNGTSTELVDVAQGDIKTQVYQTSAEATMDVRRLFGAKDVALNCRDLDMKAVGLRARQKALDFLTVAYGEDQVLVTQAFVTMPIMHTTLLDGGATGAEIHSTFTGDNPRFDDLVRTSSTTFGDWENNRWQDSTLQFTYPSDPSQGVKVTMGVTFADRYGGTRSANCAHFGLHKSVSDTSLEAPLLALREHVESDIHKVGLYSGVNMEIGAVQHGGGSKQTQPDGISSGQAPQFRGQTYEFYLCADHTVQTYVDGRFYKAFIMHPDQIARGELYNFAFGYSYAHSSISAMKVEQFAMPNDYAPYTYAPQLTAVNGWDLANGSDNQKAKIEHPSTISTHENYGAHFTNTAHYLDFTLTQEAQLRLFTHYFSGNPNLTLTRLDEGGVFTKVVQSSRNSWAIAENNLPAGRYRMALVAAGRCYLGGWEVSAPIVPAIILIGNVIENIQAGTAFVDAGVTATDHAGDDISASIVVTGTVDNTKLGSYSVQYDVTDANGNVASQVVRTVNVLDTTAPVMALVGDATISLTYGDAYSDLGATATDNLDGDITPSIVVVNPVDSRTVGSYQVSYNVTDSEGNVGGTVIRTVNVEDAVVPVISLVGSTVTLEFGTPYVDQGATAVDNADGDLTDSITVVSDVDANLLGEYSVTYNVSDASGNNAIEVIRDVHVVDTGIPEITLVGAGSIDVEYKAIYVDQGATAFDSVDGDLTGSLISSGVVDTSILGASIVSWNVSDASGNNATTVQRTVNVVDTTAPVITLLGNASESIAVDSVYVDAGATASDEVDGDMTDALIVVSDVDESIVGHYTVTYDVTDASGNVATQMTRNIEVV